MPCRDFYDDHPQAYFRDVTEPALKKQISFAESALCATLDAFETTLKDFRRAHDDMVNIDPLDYINYAEAGITHNDLKIWRKNHRELDQKHRLEEKRKKALAKLTDEEKAILGIK